MTKSSLYEQGDAHAPQLYVGHFLFFLSVRSNSLGSVKLRFILHFCELLECTMDKLIGSLYDDILRTRKIDENK
jgi:hypothetical protein